MLGFSLKFKWSEHVGWFISLTMPINSGVLDRAGMADSHPVLTPPCLLEHPFTQKISHLDNIKFYQQTVGSFHYLYLNRPDIAFATNKLSQFSSHPTANHLVSLKRVMRYLRGPINSSQPKIS